MAHARGQSLAQLALSWVLRDPRVTSALIGARTVEQLDDSLDALNAPALSSDEVDSIEQHLPAPGTAI
jgi:L-glyceraldehyde 3-phosphate reductase